MTGKKFYKYQSLREDYDKGYNCKNYTLRSLAQNQLYFSDPDNFNDPFDCRILVDFTGTEDQWIKYLCNTKGYAPEIAREKVGKFRKNKDGLVFPHKESANLRGARICCFSDKNNDILMWSHYADSHRGICLCFEGSGENEKYSMPLYKSNTDESPYSGQFEKVTYDNNNDLCVVSIFDNPRKDANMVEDRILTKLHIWHYENEYRMKIPEFHIHKQESFKYFKGCLKGIIFGLKIDKQDIIRVYNIINKNYLKEGFKVKFCEAKEEMGKYKLNIEEIPDIAKYIANLL